MLKQRGKVDPAVEHITLNVMVRCAGCGQWLRIVTQCQSMTSESQAFEVLTVEGHACKVTSEDVER